MDAKASIATRETDAVLREAYANKGKNARGQGLPQSACPCLDGMAKRWWLEGWMQEDAIRKSTG